MLRICVILLACIYFYLGTIAIFSWDKKKARQFWNLSIDFSVRTKHFGLMIGVCLYNLACFLILSVYVEPYSIAVVRPFLLCTLIWGFIVSTLNCILFSGKFFIIQILPTVIILILVFKYFS